MLLANGTVWILGFMTSPERETDGTYPFRQTWTYSWCIKRLNEPKNSFFLFYAKYRNWNEYNIKLHTKFDDHESRLGTGGHNKQWGQINSFKIVIVIKIFIILGSNLTYQTCSHLPDNGITIYGTGSQNTTVRFRIPYINGVDRGFIITLKYTGDSKFNI